MGKISNALSKAENEGEITSRRENQPQEKHEEKRRSQSHKPRESQKNSHPKKWDERLLQAVNNDPYIPEVFKVLRSRILLPQGDRKPPRTIMVTSAMPKEGKSFITANLGISLAQGMDQYSLMVNCDLRRPALSSLFGLFVDFGLVDYLRDHRNVEDIIHKTSVEKLSLIASGKPPLNPAELLGSSRMKELVEELAERYDDRFVIFDSPPYQLAAEAIALTRIVDKVILVVRQGASGRHQVKKLVESIGKKKILGVVYNGYSINIIEKSLVKGYGYESYHPQSYSL